MNRFNGFRCAIPFLTSPDGTATILLDFTNVACLHVIMKAGFPWAVCLVVFGFCRSTCIQAQEFQVAISPTGPRIELSWPTTLADTNQALVFPEFEVQYSTNLIQWQPIGGKVRGISGRSGPLLNLSLEKQPSPAFYRLSANLSSLTTNQMGDGGADLFGYNAQFADEIAPLGFLPLADFATNAANIQYLSQLTWDPTSAQFWTNFNSTNLSYLGYGGAAQTNYAYNFQLNETEQASFMTNGFVVSERLGSVTFGDAFYRLFNADMPVFVSADSILHAWHRSYQSMMEELEELGTSTLLELVISNMSLQLPQTWQQFGQGPLKDSILDADYFLTVARSLWAAQQVASALNDPGVNQHVADTIAAINSLTAQQFNIFGTNRGIDFSQFTIRGHYDASDRLRRYFRTMMWCSRIDLRLATFWPNQEYDIRQLGTAIVMQYLLQQSGRLDRWAALERITRVFVGVTDSMTFFQLGDLLSAADILSPADIPDLLTLTNLQTRLLTGELGAQSIHSDFIYSPLSPEQVEMSRSFTICGQKFVVDSWAFSQVVFDRILWFPDDPRTVFGKVIRRKPSCLDDAYSVFGNDAVVPDIVARINDTNGVPFRDGLPYQHNLLAVRKTIDRQDPSIWTDNIYSAWLAALRSLSAPTTDSSYPEAMRTHAWAMKNLNTQLASWTELRHDTVLYAKQSYTEPLLCGYPFGFVEPRPEFWAAMKALADATATAISSLQLTGTVTTVSRGTFPWPVTFDLHQVTSGEISFLQNFSGQISILQGIAVKELAQEPLSQAESDFEKNLIERTVNYYGERQWNGWYPQLFYNNVLGTSSFQSASQSPGCDIWDPMIADVHTDLPDDFVGDPGAVIHEAVGHVPMLLIAVDNGPDRMMYAGPVLSHYEIEVPGVNRLADPDWKTILTSGQKPPPPEWTQSYFVPGPVYIPPGYQ